MLGFNSPFFPEVLIASAVMAEGVDLHLECRHVIHHDLDWSPSTLEQRTGRLDRIASKAERISEPIVIYEPYLAGTYDEKVYRVVRSEEHTSELQSLMRISYAVFCLQKKQHHRESHHNHTTMK